MNVLQVGACDGMSNDPIRELVAKGRALAILLEPNPFAFARLEKTYQGLQNVILLQAAIAERDGEAFLYRIKKSDKADSDVDLSLQLASFDRGHLRRHRVRSCDIERITVPCRSLASVVSGSGITKLDLLQIDAEGFDATVVRMALALPVLPVCINFEHFHLKSADRQPLFNLLEQNEYLLNYDAWNILAVQKSALEEWKSVSLV